jgi:hypothetical protein
MGKSINPMWLLFDAQGEAISGFALGPIVLMSLRPAIPWRVALLHCLPPLHRLDSMYHLPAESVYHHSPRAGEFSTGTMGNFQPDLTRYQFRIIGTVKYRRTLVRRNLLYIAGLLPEIPCTTDQHPNCNQAVGGCVRDHSVAENSAGDSANGRSCLLRRGAFSALSSLTVSR